MDRYSMLWGTRLDNTILTLGYSAEMKPFLSKIGATDPLDTAKFVQNIFRAFTRQKDYESYAPSDKPVAIRYAPMHLHKIPNMPRNMKPFCALAINGAELAERDTFFTQTIIFSRDLMHKASEYNYLDLLFGSHIYTAEELREVREGKRKFDYDRLPSKVTPQLEDADRPCVLRVIDALYGGKNVVIRLEKGRNFNQRALELLAQIYSLLPPKFATEVGYATYQDPEGIFDLIKRTSIRIFVLSPDADLNKVRGDNLVTIDLLGGMPPAPPASPVTEAVEKWATLPWGDRRLRMELIFAGEKIPYNDGVVFAKLSADGLKKEEEFRAWMKDTSVDGSVDSIEGLIRLHKKYVDASMVPQSEELFANRCSRLLVVPMKQLINQAAVGALHGETEEAKRKSTIDLKFALSYYKPDKEILVCVAEKQKEIDDAEKAKEIEDLSRTHQEETRNLQAAREKLVEEHNAQMQNVRNELSSMQSKGKKLQEDLGVKTETLGKTEKELEKAKAEYQALKTKHEDTAKTLKEKETELTETGNEKVRLESELKTANLNLSAKEKQLKQIESEHTTLISECENIKSSLSETKEQLNQREKDISDLRAELDKAKRKLSKKESKQNKNKDANNADVGTTSFSNGDMKAKRIPLVVRIGVGVILLLLLVFVVAIVFGGKDDPASTIVPTTGISPNTTVPTETTIEATTTEATTEVPTEAPTENVIEIPVETKPAVFNDWDNAELEQIIRDSVDGVAQVELRDLWLDEELRIPEGYAVYAAVSSEQADEDDETAIPASYALLIGQVSDEDYSEQDPAVTENITDTENKDSATSANSSPKTEDKIEDKTESKNEGKVEAKGEEKSEAEPEETVQAVEDSETVLTTEQWFALKDNISMVIEMESLVILTVGDDEMVEVAIRTAAWCAISEEPQVKISVKDIDGNILDLTEISASVEQPQNWWRNTVEYSTNKGTLEEVKNYLNTKPLPVFVYTVDGVEIAVYDYVDYTQKAYELYHSKADEYKASIDGSIVTIVLPPDWK